MPKVSNTVISTAPVKAKTNFNPSSMKQETVIQPPTEAAPTEQTAGQMDANSGTTSEVKTLPPQYEALAKKESALRNREQEFKAKEAALESRIQEAVNKALGEFKSKLKSQPLDVLNEEGLTYDQLVEQAVNQPDPKTRAIEQKIQSIEDNQKRMVEESKKQADQQRQAAITQIKYDVKDLIESDAQFETIKGVDAIDDVVELITRTFDESGKLMTVEQAAKLVEEELFQEAIKIASIGKVKAKLAPQLTPELVSKQQGKQQITTLTNDMAAKRPMTPRERAIARFKGEKF